jgi:hypothetical protein
VNGERDFRGVGAFDLGEEGNLDCECLLGGYYSTQRRDADLLAFLQVVELEFEVQRHRILYGVVLNGPGST